jgi:hypothetical protein
MKLTIELLEKKKIQFDEISKHVAKLYTLIQSDEIFTIEKNFRHSIVAEYYAAQSLKIALRAQVVYIESQLTIEQIQL